MQQRAGFHILSLFFTIQVFPLAVIYTFRFFKRLLQHQTVDGAVSEYGGSGTSSHPGTSLGSEFAITDFQRHIFSLSRYRLSAGEKFHSHVLSEHHSHKLGSSEGLAEALSAEHSDRDETRVQMRQAMKLASDDTRSFASEESCICLREVLLDVLHGDTIQMRWGSRLPLFLLVCLPVSRTLRGFHCF
jgi:hypothetical protein